VCVGNWGGVSKQDLRPPCAPLGHNGAAGGRVPVDAGCTGRGFRRVPKRTSPAQRHTHTHIHTQLRCSRKAGYIFRGSRARPPSRQHAVVFNMKRRATAKLNSGRISQLWRTAHQNTTLHENGPSKSEPLASKRSTLRTSGCGAATGPQPPRGQRWNGRTVKASQPAQASQLHAVQ
jgi:hypothetical protein